MQIAFLVPLAVEASQQRKFTLYKVKDTGKSKSKNVRRGVSLIEFDQDLHGNLGGSLGGQQVFTYKGGDSHLGRGSLLDSSVALGHGDLSLLKSTSGLGSGLASSFDFGQGDISLLKSSSGLNSALGSSLDLGQGDLSQFKSLSGLTSGLATSFDFGHGGLSGSFAGSSIDFDQDDISLLKSSGGLGGFNSADVASFGSSLGLGHGFGSSGLFTSGIGSKGFSTGLHPNVFAPCEKGLLRNAYGRCVVPKVSNNLFVFNSPQRKVKVIPPGKVPSPKVHVNYVFVKAPDQALGPKPIVVPPPQEKTNIYVLSKRPVVKQDVIQVQSPPVDPEVFFVQYNDGQNQVLPGGVDLKSVLLHSQAAEQKAGGIGDGVFLGEGGVGGDLGGSVSEFKGSLDGLVSGSQGGFVVSGGDFSAASGDFGGHAQGFEVASLGQLSGGGGVHSSLDSGLSAGGQVHGFEGRIGSVSRSADGFEGSNIDNNFQQDQGVAIFAAANLDDQSEGINSVIELQPEVGPVLLKSGISENSGAQLVDAKGAEYLHSSFSEPKVAVASPTDEKSSSSLPVLTAEEVKKFSDEEEKKSA